MIRPLLPKHVAAVIKHQKDPLKALEIFRKVKTEDGFKHNLFTYKFIVDKLGSHGKFDAMECLMSEMREEIDNGLLEGVYVGVMKNYGKKGKVQEAVCVFERMDFYNCEPSVKSHNAIMNILVEYEYFDQAHKVYLRMKDKGIVPDVYTYTIRIKLFCRTRRPHAALRLLKNMPSQGCEVNAVAYCTVVGGLYDEDYGIEACKLFIQMLSCRICPDVTTFNKLIHTLCKKGDVKESERILNKVLKRGVSPNLFTFNLFIRGFCKRGALSQAANMLDRVRRDGLTPDVVTYNTLICGLCKNSMVDEAESYLHQMVNKGFDPDDFSYNTVVHGYCKLGMVEKADKILKDAVFRGFLPDEFTYCSLIDGFCLDANVDRAMAVFNDAARKGVKPPSLVLYNTLIKGLTQQGLILQALELVNEMLETGRAPNIWTYNIVINGLCKMGCLSDADDLVCLAMTRGCLPDIYTFNTLIDGYCKQMKLENAIELVDKMWSHGVAPDVITYNSVLNGLCKTGKCDAVMGIFETMVEKGCDPNIITYNILVESLCKSLDIEGACLLLEEMKDKGLAPDIVTFGTLLNGYCRKGDLDGAYRLFRSMGRQFKCSHTTATYNIMINAFAEKLNIKMAEKLFHEMDDDCCPDSYTYRALVDGFCKIGNGDSGYSYLLEMIDKGFIPSLLTFGRVINCLCFQDRVCEAVGIVHLMVRKGVVPEVVDNIFEADKREIAAPKIVVENLLKKSCITYYAYELLYDGVRDKKLQKMNT
ncbi:hypothetical protein Dimus_004888 [Dionaea muscipula]